MKDVYSAHIQAVGARGVELIGDWLRFNGIALCLLMTQHRLAPISMNEMSDVIGQLGHRLMRDRVSKYLGVSRSNETGFIDGEIMIS